MFSDIDDIVEIDDVLVMDDIDDSFLFDNGNDVEGEAICASNLEEVFSKVEGVNKLFAPFVWEFVCSVRLFPIFDVVLRDDFLVDIDVREVILVLE